MPRAEFEGDHAKLIEIDGRARAFHGDVCGELFGEDGCSIKLLYSVSQWNFFADDIPSVITVLEALRDHKIRIKSSAEYSRQKAASQNASTKNNTLKR